jgi:hypothetical protein
LHRKLNRDGFAAARFLLTASRCHLSKIFQKYFDQFLKIHTENKAQQNHSSEKGRPNSPETVPKLPAGVRHNCGKFRTKKCEFAPKTQQRRLCRCSFSFDSVALSPVKKISKVFRPVFGNGRENIVQRTHPERLDGKGVQTVPKPVPEFGARLQRECGMSGSGSCEFAQRSQRGGLWRCSFFSDSVALSPVKKFSKLFCPLLENGLEKIAQQSHEEGVDG